MNKPPKKTSQQIGKDFERWIDLSASRDCYAVPFPPIGARRIGGGAVKPIPMPFDRVLEYTPAHRMIVFDAKSTQDPNKCDVGDPTFVKLHQVQNLVRAGSRGVISGLLVEATAPAVRWIYWLDWRALTNMRPSIPWSDPRFVQVGRAGALIDFARIVGLYLKPAAPVAPAGDPIDRFLGGLKT